MIPQSAPFLLHALTELLAALSFIFTPAAQLPNPDAQTTLVLQLLGGSLLHSTLLALTFAFRPVAPSTTTSVAGWDDTGRRAALAFAFWHLWPCYRALARLLAGPKGEGETGGRAFGGPVVHLGVHGGLVLLFAWSAVQ